MAAPTTPAASTTSAAITAPANAGRNPLLRVIGLKKHFPLTRGLLSRFYAHVKAIDDVTFDIHPGEPLGLGGESGSGKTTIGRCILRLIEPTSGSIVFESTDVLTLGANDMRR